MNNVTDIQLNILEILSEEVKGEPIRTKEALKKELSNVHKHMEDYHFLRYIVTVVEDKEKTKDVRNSIAYWMDETKHGNLPFNDIFVVDDEVYIYTYRPGVWIGKAGCVIENLQERINHKVDGTKYRDLHINLIEVKDDAMSDVYNCFIAMSLMKD